MDEKKIQEIFSDEAFVTSLLAMDTPEEVQTAVKAKGLDLTIGDIEMVKAQLVSGKTDELSADDLEGVAGGFGITALATIAAIVGITAGVAGIWVSTAGIVHSVTRSRW